jgi:hypothetical protein
MSGWLSSQGHFIRRQDNISDAFHDIIAASVRDDTRYNISVTIEPLVRILSAAPALVPDPPEEENDPAAKDIAPAVDTEDQQYVEEMPRHYHAPHDPGRTPFQRYRGQGSRPMLG